LYKTYGHYKYTYAVLLYLVKCIAILPPAQALSESGTGLFMEVVFLEETFHLTYRKNMIIRSLRPCGATWVQTLTNTMQKEQQELWNQGTCLQVY